MTFQELATTFAQAEAGTDSFKNLYKNAFRLMNEDRDNAALYFVVGVAARSYVHTYEDQGVSVEKAHAAKVLLTGFNDKLLQALQGTAEQSLQAVNEIAHAYEWTVPDF